MESSGNDDQAVDQQKLGFKFLKSRSGPHLNLFFNTGNNVVGVKQAALCAQH